MMRTRIPITALTLAGAVVCVFLSTLGHDAVKAMLDARSADGDVESYTSQLHASIQMRLRLVAAFAVILTTGLVLARKRFDRAAARFAGNAHTFLSDVRSTTALLWRSTHGAERWAVLILLAVALALRIAQLGKAVTYDEAFTCTYYAVRPWYIIISDYSYPNNHILHTLLVKCSLALFGWGELQARIPAFCAGMVALVCCWIWARSAFGRGVALLTLAIAAGSGPLIDYGALARGYSITWSCFMVALLLAGHFVRTGNGLTGLMLALVNALGMWAVPTMIYASAMVYAWILLQVLSGASADRRRLIRELLLTGSAFVLFTLVLYAPVIAVYGPGQLFYDETMGPRVWTPFTVDARTRIAGAALIAILVSRSYRTLMSALLLAVVPIVLIQHMIGPVRIWIFLLFILLPAVPLVVKWSLEQLHRVVAMDDRLRGVLFGSVSLLAFALAVPRALPIVIKHFPGASDAAGWFTKQLQPTDRVLVNVPCEAPLEFYFKKYGFGIEPLYRKPAPGSRLWFIVGKGYDHTFEALAARAHLPAGSWSDPRPVRDLDGLTIFAARY